MCRCALIEDEYNRSMIMDGRQGRPSILLLLSSRVRVGAVLLGWWVVGNGKFSLPQVRKNFLRIVAELVAELRRERGMVTWQHRHIIGRVEPVARKAVSNVAPPYLFWYLLVLLGIFNRV